MPKEFVFDLGADYSKALRSLQQFEKEANKVLGRIGKSSNGAGGEDFQLKRNSQLTQKYIEAQYRQLFDESKQLANATSLAWKKRLELSLQDAKQYYKDLEDLEKRYQEYLRKEAAALEKINKESLKDAKEYYRERERQEREYQNYLAEEERIISRLNAEEEKRRKEFDRDSRSATYRDMFDEIAEQERQIAAINEQNRKTREAMYRDMFDEIAEQEKRYLNESLNDTREYYQELERQEKAYQDYLAEEERIINDTIRDNANVMVDAYTEAVQKVIHLIGEMFREAIAYVKEYDKALTSIAVVKGDSAIKNTLGPQLEAMAKEMSVTATELAAAAEELYRQGLDDSEVLSRMESITTYAKISGETFSEAVELITASVNSFAKEGESTADLTEHIVDVWSYLGDAVATSSGEIGTAMQKVAASGQAAGFTLEELSASIAVIESNTRAAAESVGTALNSMASRYMKVSSAGWNQFITTDEGDVVRINDIAKAMDSVGLSIVDANGKFLEFADVLNQLHTIWPTLSDAQKNYIATQMAGTRSLNYFLSLMNNYGDVLKLTEEAYDSAGTGAQKYAVWLEGAEAAQNRLIASLQDLYSDLVSPDAVIWFIEALTEFVENIDKADLAIGGFAAGAALLISWFGKFKSIAGTVTGSLKAIWTGFTTAGTAAGTATVSITAFRAALMSIGVGIVIAAVSTLVSMLFNLGKEAKNTADIMNNAFDEIDETTELLTKGRTDAKNLKELSRELETLSQKTTLTADEAERFNEIREIIISESPDIAAAYGIEKEAVQNLGIEYENTAKSLESLRAEQAKQNWYDAKEGLDAAKKAVDAYNKTINTLAASFEYKGLGSMDSLIDNSKEIIEGSEIFELEGYVALFDDAINEFSQKWNDAIKTILGEDFDISDTSTQNEVFDLIDQQIADLQTLQSLTDDANWDQEYQDKIDLLVNFRAALTDAYGEIWNLTNDQAEYQEAINQRQLELAEGQKEALDVIITASSNAPRALEELGVDAYQSILDSLYTGDYTGMSSDEVEAYINDVFLTAINGTREQLDAKLSEIVPEEITPDEPVEVEVEVVPTVSFEDYEAAEKIRDNIQLLYDSAYAMGTGGEVDFSALFEAYPQLIEYASDRIALQEQINILLASETEANDALLEQYGLQIEKVEDLNDALNAHVKGENKAADAATKLRKGQSLTADTLKDLIDEYPELTEAILDFADGALDAEGLIKKLDKAAESTNVQNFKEQFENIGAQLSDAAEGGYEYTAALERMGYLMSGGMGEMSSLEFAKAHLDDIRAAIEGDIDAFYRLAQAAVINIVGSANVDFSAAEQGLLTVYNAAGATVEQLKNLGLFEIETVTTDNEVPVQTGIDLKTGAPIFDTTTLKSTFQVLRWKGSNTPFNTPSSSGGGSSPSKGGGGSKPSEKAPEVSKKVQKKISKAEERLEPYDYRLEIAQALQEYYEATGQLGKSIPFIQEQIDIYKELAEIYKQNVEELQPLADAKKKEIDQTESEIDKLKKKRDQYEKGSAEYKKYTKKIKELKEELDALNLDYDELVEKIQEYELAGLDAAKMIELLNQAIKDQQRAIRQAVIDVKNQLRDYFEEIEDAEKKQLDSTISMQDKVLEILREQAREELDIQKDKLEQKKSMLEEELDALRENFEEARKLAEDNETQQTLEEKQRELAAVMADPTRAKERAALEKEIAELQTDLAWQTAEEQIAAQEAAMQEEIDAIDVELDKLEEAYDEIETFNEEMIQKMKEILEMNSDDIVKWLKDNSSEYADSTDEARQKLEDDWKETADNMKGIIEDIWKDIDNIMKGGLDEAIELLRKTDKYKNASDEERQEMEDQLKDLWKDMEDADDPPEPGDRTPGDDNNKEEPVEPEDPTLTVTTRNREVELHKKHKGDSKVLKTIPKKTELVLDGYHGKWVRTTYDGKTGWVKIDDIKTEFDKKKLKKYAQGGLLDSTGPIWVDGTAGRPERILSAHQNELFERFIATLEKWKMPNFDGHTNTASETLHVEEGAVVVQIGSLNDGSDYEEVGQKVMDAIYQKFKVRR